jgi:hypothetical protein
VVYVRVVSDAGGGGYMVPGSLGCPRQSRPRRGRANPLFSGLAGRCSWFGPLRGRKGRQKSPTPTTDLTAGTPEAQRGSRSRFFLLKKSPRRSCTADFGELSRAVPEEQNAGSARRSRALTFDGRFAGEIARPGRRPGWGHPSASSGQALPQTPTYLPRKPTTESLPASREEAATSGPTLFGFPRSSFTPSRVVTSGRR